MSKPYVFVLFQGWGNNLKVWNDYTECHFLDQLKNLGPCFTIQDSTYNILYYSKDPDADDYDRQIEPNDFKVDLFVQKVFLLLQLSEYSDHQYIPIGFSFGGLMALYFAQIYSFYCLKVYLFDPATFIPSNTTLELEFLKQRVDKIDISLEVILE
ncbi:MAG: hypothetical protein K2X95_01480, partial [Flavobacteriaceae bacterium]|nr:hypothetical protein [Flavobacteriaceae bacterium]